MSKKTSRGRRRRKDLVFTSRGNRPQVPLSDVSMAWSALSIAIAVLVAYSPAIGGYFLWDDDAHVTRPELRSLHGLWRIWSDVGATQQYYPVLHSAFWFEHTLWGNSVVGYHLVNILFHAVSACLILLILRRLKIPGAALAAGIFALHPVHVESVAWISEQKNTLSMVFYLAATYVYLHFDDERPTSSYLLASVLFVLGLLTKTVVATLPAALLLIFWWRRGRLSARQDVLPLAPWFALGAAAGLLTAWFERGLIGAEGADFNLSLLQRTMLAGRVVWFYLGKLFWPVNLTFIYPRWQIDTSIWPQALFTLATLAVLVTFSSIRRRSRAPLAIALFFIGSLFPVLGFFNVYPFVFSFVADHFQYVPSLGIITGVAAGFTVLWTRVGWRRGVGAASAIALLVMLGTLSWRQSHVYSDPVTLYETTLIRNPDCYLCVNNLGTIAFQSGRVDEAVERFREALRIKPESAEAQNNLANLLVETGSIAEGIEHYRQSLTIAPNNVVARTNLGIALFRLQRIPEARAQFEEALRIMPGYEPAQQNLKVVEALQRNNSKE